MERTIEPLPIGFILGDYKIERIIARGGFGITYLATHTTNKQTVVVKENIPGNRCSREAGQVAFNIPEEDAQNLNKGGAMWAQRNFMNEARALKEVNHEGVVPVLAGFQSKVTNTCYYVMPFVESASLNTLVKQGFNPAYDWIHFALCSLLKSLKAVHDKHLLHRDIKPDNILIREDGLPILIDFGSARRADSGEHTRIITENYSPIELSRGSGEGPWTDLYSLGATLYRVITGKHVPDLALRGGNDAYVPLLQQEKLRSRFGEKLLWSIDHVLSYEPNQRFSSADEWLNYMKDVPGFQSEEYVVPPILVAASAIKAGRDGSSVSLTGQSGKSIVVDGASSILVGGVTELPPAGAKNGGGALPIENPFEQNESFGGTVASSAPGGKKGNTGKIITLVVLLLALIGVAAFLFIRGCGDSTAVTGDNGVKPVPVETKSYTKTVTTTHQNVYKPLRLITRPGIRFYNKDGEPGVEAPFFAVFYTFTNENGGEGTKVESVYTDKDGKVLSPEEAQRVQKLADAKDKSVALTVVNKTEKAEGLDEALLPPEGYYTVFSHPQEVQDAKKILGYFKKEYVYEWPKNLVMRIIPDQTNDRALVFDTQENAQDYFGKSHEERKELYEAAQDVEEGPYDAVTLKEKGESYKVNKQLLKDRGVLAMEPQFRAGEMLLPVLEYVRDEIKGGAKEYQYDTSSNPSYLLNVAALTARKKFDSRTETTTETKKKPATEETDTTVESTENTMEVEQAVVERKVIKPEINMVFVIDTTKSMNFAVNAVRDYVLRQADKFYSLAEEKNVKISFGLVAYRDWRWKKRPREGQSYPTEEEKINKMVDREFCDFDVHNFTADKLLSIDKFKEMFEKQPEFNAKFRESVVDSVDLSEEVHGGLYELLRKDENGRHVFPWSDRDPQDKDAPQVMRMVVLIGDAPGRDPGQQERKEYFLGSKSWHNRATGNISGLSADVMGRELRNAKINVHVMHISPKRLDEKRGWIYKKNRWNNYILETAEQLQKFAGKVQGMPHYHLYNILGDEALKANSSLEDELVSDIDKNTKEVEDIRKGTKTVIIPQSRVTNVRNTEELTEVLTKDLTALTVTTITALGDINGNLTPDQVRKQLENDQKAKHTAGVTKENQVSTEKDMFYGSYLQWLSDQEPIERIKKRDGVIEEIKGDMRGWTFSVNDKDTERLEACILLKRSQYEALVESLEMVIKQMEKSYDDLESSEEESSGDFIGDAMKLIARSQLAPEAEMTENLVKQAQDLPYPCAFLKKYLALRDEAGGSEPARLLEILKQGLKGMKTLTGKDSEIRDLIPAKEGVVGSQDDILVIPIYKLP